MSKERIVEVKVVPNAKGNEIKEDGGRFKVYITAPPVDGKANKLLIELLAKHLGVKKSNINIIRGEKSRDKIIQID